MLAVIILILFLINIGIEARAKGRSLILYVIFTLALWFGARELMSFLLDDVIGVTELSNWLRELILSSLPVLLCLGLFRYLNSRKDPD